MEEAVSEDEQREEETVMPLMEEDTSVEQIGERDSKSLEEPVNEADINVPGNCDQGGLRSPESEGRSSIVEEGSIEPHNNVIEDSTFADLLLVPNSHDVAREDFSQQVRQEDLNGLVLKEVMQEDLSLDLVTLPRVGLYELMDEALLIEGQEKEDEAMALEEEESVTVQLRGLSHRTRRATQCKDSGTQKHSTEDNEVINTTSIATEEWRGEKRDRSQALAEYYGEVDADSLETEDCRPEDDSHERQEEEPADDVSRDSEKAHNDSRDHVIQDRSYNDQGLHEYLGYQEEDGSRRQRRLQNDGIYHEEDEQHVCGRKADAALAETGNDGRSHEEQELLLSENELQEVGEPRDRPFRDDERYNNDEEEERSVNGRYRNLPREGCDRRSHRERGDEERRRELTRDSEEAHDNNRRHVVLDRSHNDQGLHERFGYEDGSLRERRIRNDGLYNEEDERLIDSRYSNVSSIDVDRDRRRERGREEQIQGDLHHRYERNRHINRGYDVRQETNHIHRREERQESRHEGFSRGGFSSNYEDEERHFSRSRNNSRREDHYSRRNYDGQAAELSRRGEIDYRHVEDYERRADGGRERYEDRRQEGFGRSGDSIRDSTREQKQFAHASSYSRYEDEGRRGCRYNESRDHNGSGRNFQRDDSRNQGGSRNRYAQHEESSAGAHRQEHISQHDILCMGRRDRQHERDRFNYDRQDQSRMRDFGDLGGPRNRRENERRPDAARSHNDVPHPACGGFDRPQEYETGRYDNYRGGNYSRRGNQGGSSSHFGSDCFRQQRGEASRVDVNVRRDVFDTDRRNSGEQGNRHANTSRQPPPHSVDDGHPDDDEIYPVIFGKKKRVLGSSARPIVLE